MKKNKLILLQLFIAFTLICTSVYAAFTTTISLSVDKSTVKRGEEIVVTLSLDEVDSSKKVTNVEGYINYDKKVIEPITVDSIEKDAENKVTIGNETLEVEDLTNASKDDVPGSSAYIVFNGNPETKNGEKQDTRIVIDFKDGLTTEEDLLKIKFKVKSDATLGEIEKAISYSMFVITAGGEELDEPITKSVNLTVEKVNTNQDDGNNNNNNNNDNNDKNENKNDDQSGNKGDNKNESKNENKNENKNNNNTNTNENANTNKATNTNTNTKDNTVAGAKIPAAGAKIFIVPVIILIVLAYVSYNKFMKMKGI